MALNGVKVFAFFLYLHSCSTFPTVTEIFHNGIEIILPVTDYVPFVLESAIK